MPRTFTRTITTPAAARMVRPSTRPVVSLVTDFGGRDPSAGIMRAVVLAIAPDALVIDVSHEVDKYRIRDGALLLWCAVPYLPHGAHVAVVDPGVGTQRRGLAIETARGDFLVGPDNGILLPAATRLGGIVRAHQLLSPQYRLPVISSSFHGRDIFAPAAAHLAMGLPLDFLGPAQDPRSLVLLDWPEPQAFAGVLRSQVIYVDTFGNVKLSALTSDLGASLGQVRYGERLWLRLTDQYGSNDVEVTWVETFAGVAIGQPLLFEDSYGRLCIAINQGSATIAMGIREDAEVLVTRAQLPRLDAPAQPIAEVAQLAPPPADAARNGTWQEPAWADPAADEQAVPSAEEWSEPPRGSAAGWSTPAESSDGAAAWAVQAGAWPADGADAARSDGVSPLAWEQATPAEAGGNGTHGGAAAADGAAAQSPEAEVAGEASSGRGRRWRR
jgi:S-adenosylmethionine hydrolase